ncbi:hypothetical protein CEQ90_03415 [Lewinellaceae bacterium SD302]|nr:hypothetical protein CEQ90_03415 [Lewinellaceae bacterium SD302]
MEDEILDENLTVEYRKYDSQTIVRINDAKIQLGEDLNNIITGRTTLFALFGLNVLGLFVGMITDEYGDLFVGTVLEFVVLGCFYLLLGYLVPRRPLLYLALGVGLYVLVLIGNAIIMSETIFVGFFVKIAVFYGFFRGISGALSLRRTKERLSSLGVPEEEIKQAIRTLKPIPRTG